MEGVPGESPPHTSELTSWCCAAGRGAAHRQRELRREAEELLRRQGFVVGWEGAPGTLDPADLCSEGADVIKLDIEGSLTIPTTGIKRLTMEW